jgi:HD-GYP domain-containing protein (c-di-GMP phosphodiesterase class II)/integral membrane sensor domain MASE1
MKLENNPPSMSAKNREAQAMKEKPAASTGGASLYRDLRPLWRPALIVAAYLCAFIILDFAARQFEELPAVVAWYPPAGLTYALLLVFGVRFAPTVTIALFISSLFVYRMPQPAYALLLWASVISSIYGAAAAFLRQRIRFDWRLRTLRDVISLVVTTAVVSALLAVLSVSSVSLSSDMPPGAFLGAIFDWWIGETVGVLTVTPFLLVYVMPGLKRFAKGQPIRLPARWSWPPSSLSVLGSASILALSLFWVFGASLPDEIQPLYLLTLPLIWIALRHGFKGVTAAILALNFGVVLAQWLFRLELAHLGELQLLMIVNCVVGLLMGAVVTARQQAEEALRLRLAEMEGLHAVSTALRVAQTRDEALPILLDQTLAALATDSGAIWLYYPEHDELRPAITLGWFRQLKEAPLKRGEGIVGAVFASGQSHVSPAFRTDPAVGATTREQIPNDWGGACVPIHTGAITIGVLIASMPPSHPITPGQMGLLESLAELAGAALHRMSLHEETVRQLDHLQALHRIDQAIAGSMDLRTTLNVLLENVLTQLKSDAASVLLLDPQRQMLEYAAGRGFRTGLVQTARIRLGEGLAGRVALERRAVQAHDAKRVQENRQLAALWAREGFAAYFGLPLIAKGQVKGVLEVFHRTAHTAGPEWVDFLETLAGQAAIAIDNNGLFDGLQRSNAELIMAYEATLEGWSRAMDLRDKETEGHSQRVTEITVRLAIILGVPDSALAQVRRGALLHDIGKLGVPDQILLKPGKLTDEEWVIMRSHPQLAYDLLSPITYLKPALDIPYCHHEKWDGAGYPRQLKGDEIPLPARVFAVADVWDALGSDRPYRPAWPRQKIVVYMREQSGTHFDPRVLEAFLTMMGE